MWGIDFIEEISDKSSGVHSWILVAIDYFIKWVEAIHTRQSTNKVVIKFFTENILTRLGIPQKIIVDNGMCFRSNEFAEFCRKYGSVVSYSSPYHLQGNGQVESSNRKILKIIKRMLDNNKRTWDSKLNLALWVDRIMVKKSTCFSPFNLVYEKEAKLSLNNLLPIYKFVTEKQLEDVNFMENRLNALIELDEVRRLAQEQNISKQQQVKFLHDKKSSKQSFRKVTRF